MKPIISHWQIDTLTIVFVTGLICMYYMIHSWKPQKNVLYFWTAIVLFLLVTSSPLHYLGMHYYFSAHMITHVILLLICGPLIVLSLSKDMAPSILKRLRAFSSFINRYSWLAWFAGAGIMWLWHIPTVFDATFRHSHAAIDISMTLHSGSMLIAGIIFSWPLLNPFPEYRIHALVGVLYLFTSCVSCSLLGLLITFAPLGTYQHYLTGMHMGTMVNPWHLTHEADQQAAGLIMWVPCCFVYLAGCIFLLHRWFSENIADKELIETT